ncbi:GNAT family N-acetyltransferase [Virgibacillus sediminis]|uniref:GNAT family N-acetyltransferase n=1 Tax=Virgibacillus sediminis TaxID=202260 RepID=A0ABV7A1Y0_9BACI
MTINIEIANKDDFKAVNSIIKEGHNEHAEALPHIFKDIDQVMPGKNFNELLEDPNCEVLIVKEYGDIVGFAVIELSESPPFDSMTPRKFAYMSDFGVKRSSQRKGIGRELFNECLNWAKNRGADSLDLNVGEFNRKAISFYENFGMKTVSRKMTLPIK